MRGLILPWVTKHMTLPSSTPPAVPAAKANDAQGDDFNGAEGQEGFGVGRAADREAQKRS